MAGLYSTDTVKQAEEAVRCLSDALGTGDGDQAVRCVQDLVTLGVPVCVKLADDVYSREQIRLRVWVEDAVSEAHITTMVTPGTTISELKEKIDHDYGFHPAVQSWILGKRLAQDTDTLSSHGILDHDQVFLFIRTAHSARLSREQQKLETEERKIGGIIENLEALTLQSRGTGAPIRHPPGPKRRALRPAKPPTSEPGWSCQQCTYVNKPTRPGCEMCSCDRPETYRVPDLYQPDEDEVHRIQQEALASLQYEQAVSEERQRNFLSLLETDNQDLVSNRDELDCTICYSPVPPGEGATLRECLHTFCRECLKQTVLNCLDAEVKCPYADQQYSCNCTLQDREIRTLLSEGEHQRFLELRLSIAETRSENSYHCKTLDCPGWCIFEDDVNEFTCDTCRQTNCLLCKAIHDGMNCKEYQDDLHLRAQNDAAAKKTTEMLEMMLKSGEAMNCPKCRIIVQKKDGCDWICCVMCRTEICWVTKQARWGPQGAGDTSAGCRCRLNGVVCHPNCQNCH